MKILYLLLILCLMTGCNAKVPPAGALAVAPQQVELLKQRAAVRWDNLPRKTLAFYYGWYGNPSVSGSWVHWENVETEKKQIGNSTHFPTLGAYDSNDPKVIEQHCLWAKQAGLDGFIVTWWRPNDFHDKGLPRLLDAAAKHGLQVCVYYEVVPDVNDIHSIVKDFGYILNTYGNHPAYIRIQDKPVIFIYSRALGQVSMIQWVEVLDKVNKTYPPGVFAIADQLSRMASRLFDGIHTYNICGQLEGKPVSEIGSIVEGIYQPPFNDADSYQRLTCLTVIPGYDDTKIRNPGINTQRFNGDSYRQQWETALKMNPHWVLVTSFNEWHEGSEIEPSEEHGDLYIQLTAEYTRRFKALSPRPARPASGAAAGLSQQEKEKLRARYVGKKIAVLPGAQSEAVYWLLTSDLETEFLTAEQCADKRVLTPQNYPYLVYASNEAYQSRSTSKGDIDQALENYLKAGGCLIALSNEPFPFYYNEDGPAGNAQSFGLRLGSSKPQPEPGWGFERPPSNLQLTFRVEKTLLPSLPDSIPFPTDGDLRWRPFLGRDLPAGNEYQSFIALYDHQNRWWGDGAAWVHYKTSEPKEGKVVYVWFRLLDPPHADKLLYNLFYWLGR